MRNPIVAAADELRMQATYYKGASYDRLNQDWYMGRISADMAMRFDLQALRSRARELVANNSTAHAIPKILRENVIGKDGIVLQARIETTRGKLNESVNAQIEDGWAEFSEHGNCSADGQGGMVDLQGLWVGTECIDGETILHHVEGYDNKWGYAIDTIDADQLDHMYNIIGAVKTNAIRMGVEVNRWHRPVRYWMWTAHPTDPEGKTREPVDAVKLEHVYEQIRPKATRGITWFAPVIFDLNMLGGYRDAEITAARVAACAMAFFTQDESSGGNMAPTDGGDVVPMRMEPALMRQLPPGYKVDTFAPNHPNTAFEKFDQAVIRSISTAQRLSYMSMSNDLSATSFASGRIGLLAERAVFQSLQQRFIRRVLTPVYRRWLKCAMLSGALKLPSMNPAAYYNVAWHARAFPWIDPSKDIDVVERSVAMGTDSLTRVCHEQGRDFEDVLKQRKQEIDLAEKYGVPLVISAGRAKPINVDVTQEAETDEAGGNDSAPPAPSKTAPAPARNGTRGNGRNGHHSRIPVLD